MVASRTDEPPHWMVRELERLVLSRRGPACDYYTTAPASIHAFPVIRGVVMIEQLRNVVAESPTVRASVGSLVGKVAGVILDTLGKPDELKKFAEDLLANQGDLGAAVAVGTAAEDEKGPDAEPDAAKRRSK